MTRLELIYPTPHGAHADRLEHTVRRIMQNREPDGNAGADTQPYHAGTTTRVRVWHLPNRRLARVARRQLREAFKECGEPEPGVSITSERGRRL